MQISSVAMAGSAFLFDLKKDENKNNNNRELKMNLLFKRIFQFKWEYSPVYIEANFDHLDPHINFSDDDLANKRPIFSLCIC